MSHEGPQLNDQVSFPYPSIQPFWTWVDGNEENLEFELQNREITNQIADRANLPCFVVQKDRPDFSARLTQNLHYDFFRGIYFLRNI